MTTTLMRRFVAELLADPKGTQTQAYIRAGGSPRGAQQASTRMAGRPDVKALIEKGQKRVMAPLERKAEDYARRIDEIAFSEPAERAAAGFKSGDIVAAIGMGAKMHGMLKDKVEMSGGVTLRQLVPPLKPRT